MQDVKTGPKVGQWYLLDSGWARVVKVGARFATLIGKSGRRYVPLAELAGRDAHDRNPAPPA